jgi:hypothetical protein
MSKPPVGIKTKANPNIKTYCYKQECGPVIETGFNLEKYQVCTKCKEEVNEILKGQIDYKVSQRDPVKEVLDSDDWEEGDGLPGFFFPGI